MYEGKQYDRCMIQKNWISDRDISVCATETGKNLQMTENGVCSRSCLNESKTANASCHDNMSC